MMNHDIDPASPASPSSPASARPIDAADPTHSPGDPGGRLVRQPRQAALDLIRQACLDRGYGGPVQFVRLEAAIDAVVQASSAADAASVTGPLRGAIADQAIQIAELRTQLRRCQGVVDAVGPYVDGLPASVAAAYRAHARSGER